MKTIPRIILLLALLIVFSVTNTGIGTSQQPGAIAWSGETVLHENPGKRTQLFFPAIAADYYGVVHVLWPEGQTIYYLQKNVSGWMQPIDVVYAPGQEIQFVSIAIDQNGILHLVWGAFGNIYYKSVPAWQAEYVQLWSEERIIGQTGGINTPLRIGVDPNNGLHVIFADWNGKEGNTTAGNVYHFSSLDEGETWSNYHQVSNVPGGDVATDPRMAFDDQGRIHIVWGQFSPDLDALQQGVYYSRLSISDQTVTPPKAIALREEDYKWTTAINIAINHGEEIQAVWTCGDQARRCQSRSGDGGDNWTAPQQIFGDLIGLSGWDAMFVDGADNLYWMGVLRYPQAMYYSFVDTGFGKPPLVASQDTYMKLGENLMVAVGLGNEAHAVINLGNKIVYMSGITSAEKEPALPEPNLLEVLKQETQPMLTQTPSNIVVPVSTEINPNLQSDQIINLNSNLTILSISIFAIVITLSLALGIVLVRKRST